MGKYLVEAVLGTGGMATVYAARHRNKKRVALKMLHPEFSGNADVRARFLREGYVANTVDHPGAVAVLDEDVAEDGSAFLVMELLFTAHPSRPSPIRREGGFRWRPSSPRRIKRSRSSSRRTRRTSFTVT